VKLAKVSISTSSHWRDALAVLPEKDAELTRHMVDAWMDHRLGSQRHQPESVSFSVTVVADFIRHARAAPWAWTERQFDSWCYDVGVVRRVATSTQRKYQSAIRQFLKYLVINTAFQNEVRLAYGHQIRQICTSENMIPHLYPVERATERNALSREHIEHFFSEFDEQIQIAAQFRSKSLRPLQRDKVLFAIMYYGGLRADEVLRLNVDSFHENPQNPLLGPFASMSVWGKGSNGGGKKLREVCFTTLDVPPLLQFYLTQVRPHFLKLTNANEKALFLSQHGTRLIYASLHGSFRRMIQLCGLSGMGYCPHSFRHSSVTHEAARFSLMFNRDKHGHVYASTTEHYYHAGDEANGAELNRALQAQVDAAAARSSAPSPDRTTSTYVNPRPKAQ
jgi:site-specific recombinase XerD